MDRHVNHPNEPSLVGDPDRFAKAANLTPSSFATLKISPAGSDARKTAQPHDDIRGEGNASKPRLPLARPVFTRSTFQPL
jgi:hypothetical protein